MRLISQAIKNAVLNTLLLIGHKFTLYSNLDIDTQVKSRPTDAQLLF